MAEWLKALVGKDTMSFIDASGVSVILCQQGAAICNSAQGLNRVHHSFIVDAQTYKTPHHQLPFKGVDVEFEEDRQSVVINGALLY